MESPLLRTCLACSLSAALTLFTCGCTAESGAAGSQAGSASGDDTIDLADVSDIIEDEPQPEPYELSVESLDGIPSSGLEAFSLTDADAPEIDAELFDAIAQAIEAVESSGDVGFVLLDVDSGQGIAYNTDAEIYGASSFKALYALYLCEDLEENGLATLTDGARSLVESAILYSSNEAYTSLRGTYDDIDFDAWATALGTTDVLIRADSNYPWYCARSSAKLWVEMYLYLQTGTDDATWLDGLVSSTETSFLRDALADTGATVRNKAGWCAGSQEKYNSTTDAGIVELDGRTYVFTIMTAQSYSDAAVERYAALAQAVFAARDCLIME